MLKFSINNKAFRCPRCGNKIPSNELYNLNKNHQTRCLQCNAHLTPKKPIPLGLCFITGFLAFVIPAKSVTSVSGSLIYGLLFGIACSFIIILAGIIYLYNTVELIEVNQ